MRQKLLSKGLQVRYEQFGGIIASEEPPFLAHVDREFMKEIGYKKSDAWQGEEDFDAPLSAPLEVHFSITNKCSAGCSHCYTGATPQVKDELSFEDICSTIDSLAKMGVFHMALGGGEALERNDLFEIAAYARQQGIVPNLTTAGYAITEENVYRFKVFGQVNISIDTLNAEKDTLRKGDIQLRVTALKLLKKHKIRCGVNTVLSRNTYEDLPELLKMVKKIGIREIELLRLKPSGRAASDLYQQNRLTDEQHINLFKNLKQLYRKYRIHLKIDCSFVPMVVWHNPDKEFLEKMSLYGCDAGSVLLGITPKGTVSGCSFLTGDTTTENLETLFDSTEGHIAECRNWSEQAPEPCSSCPYLSLCKGGCRAVSIYTTNDFFTPDPECPRVISYKENHHDS